MMGAASHPAPQRHVEFTPATTTTERFWAVPAPVPAPPRRRSDRFAPPPLVPGAAVRVHWLMDLLTVAD